MSLDDALLPAYFATYFRQSSPGSDWPEEFAVITAYATTGETWTDEQNAAADRALEAELRNLRRWLRRLTGYSPSTGHAEPGWAVELSLDVACEIGCRYKQDAVYFVRGDLLYVTRCKSSQRKLNPVGVFRERLCRLDDRHSPPERDAPVYEPESK